MVKLRKLMSEVKFVGNTAPAFVLRNPRSRKLPNVPAKVIAVEPKLLAWLFNRISELIAVDVIEVANVPPVAVIAPVSLILPPETNVRLRPIVDVPNTKAVEFVKLTSLAPLLDNDTAPVKTFACVKVIALAP